MLYTVTQGPREQQEYPGQNKVKGLDPGGSIVVSNQESNRYLVVRHQICHKNVRILDSNDHIDADHGRLRTRRKACNAQQSPSCNKKKQVSAVSTKLDTTYCFVSLACCRKSLTSNFMRVIFRPTCIIELFSSVCS